MHVYMSKLCFSRFYNTLFCRFDHNNLYMYNIKNVRRHSCLNLILIIKSRGNFNIRSLRQDVKVSNGYSW